MTDYQRAYRDGQNSILLAVLFGIIGGFILSLLFGCAPAAGMAPNCQEYALLEAHTAKRYGYPVRIVVGDTDGPELHATGQAFCKESGEWVDLYVWDGEVRISESMRQEIQGGKVRVFTDIGAFANRGMR